MARALSRRSGGLAILGVLAFAPVAGATLQNQPAAEASYTTTTLYGGAGSSDVFQFGNEELHFSNGFTAPVPPSGTNPCSASIATSAGVGMPTAPTLVNDVVTTAHCAPGSDVGPVITTYGEADSILLYKIKGPAATGSSTPVRLGGSLHGALSASLDFGEPENGAFSVLQVYWSADVTPRLSGIGLISGSLYAKPNYYSPPSYLLPGGDLLLGDIDDQSNASTAYFGIDHSFQGDATLSGWVATLRTALICEAETDVARSNSNPTASCDFDAGEAYLESPSPSVIFERIAPLEPTSPRSAAYLSPASGPIQTYPGTAGVPTTASGAGDLGQGAIGSAQATTDFVTTGDQTSIRTRAGAQVDQSAITADGAATVVAEGQSATSLVYHVNPGPGYAGTVNAKIVYTADFTVSVTKDLDPSIVQAASFAVTTDLNGAPFYHFMTLSAGDSNEDPPGLSGNIGTFACIDQSTLTTQACQFTNIPQDNFSVARPDADGNLVLTVQTDCTTRLVHPSGAVAAAHPTCDATHTITATLVSNDATATLTAVPEPEADELGVACVGVLVLWRRRAG